MCRCIAQVDRLLAAKNSRLVVTLALKNGEASRTALRTEQIETGRGKAKAVAVIPTFCPFCGKKYPTKATGREPGQD